MNKIAAFLRGFSNGLEKRAFKTQMTGVGGVSSSVRLGARETADLARGQSMRRSPASNIAYASSQQPVASNPTQKANMFRPTPKIANPFAHIMGR